MLINSDCTLYLFDKVTNGFTRHFIPDVYWDNSKSANILKSGLQNIDSVTVYLYSDKIKPLTPQKDILVKGNCDFEFGNTSAKAISDSMKKFREQCPDFVTVNSIDEAMFGGLPHIEISAR